MCEKWLDRLIRQTELDAEEASEHVYPAYFSESETDEEEEDEEEHGDSDVPPLEEGFSDDDHMGLEDTGGAEFSDNDLANANEDTREEEIDAMAEEQGQEQVNNAGSMSENPTAAFTEEASTHHEASDEHRLARRKMRRLASRFVRHAQSVKLYRCVFQWLRTTSYLWSLAFADSSRRLG